MIDLVSYIGLNDIDILMIDNYFTENEISIHYQEYPNPGAETVIFLHFGGGDISLWEAVIPKFKDKYHIVIPEMRGHGHSFKPEKGYRLEDITSDVVKLMDHLNIKKAYFVGSSLGAGTAVCLAANYPDRVIALSCEGAFNNEFGPYGLVEDSEEIAKQKHETLERMKDFKPRRYNSIEERIQLNKEWFKEQKMEWSIFYENSIKYSTIEAEDGKYKDLASDNMRNELVEVYWDLRFEEYYKRISIPVVFFPGDADIENPRIKNALQAFAAMVPQSKIVHIEGTMHAFMSFTHPDRYAAEILEFFAGN
ncbi:MAG: alpha/beta fold hydrolase [Candidatus Kariarchaeaceae archaeon]|jgi:2-succinyl-6-hydroxy-2,4-cyclohexadiene-1-carboxylate synthase